MAESDTEEQLDQLYSDTLPLKAEGEEIEDDGLLDVKLECIVKEEGLGEFSDETKDYLPGELLESSMVEGSSIFLQPRQDEPSLQQTAGTSIKTEGGCLQPKMYPCLFEQPSPATDDKSKEYKFSCNDCQYVTNTPRNFKHHQLSHTWKPKKRARDSELYIGDYMGEPRYQCNECEYTAKTTYDVKLHVENKHRGIRHKCPLCDFTTTKKSHLGVHKRSAHDGIRFPCEHCGFQAKTRGSLKSHTDNKHLGIKHNCPALECDFVGNTYSQMYLHFKSVHQGVTYPCDRCEYVAKTAGSLKAHKLTHEEKKLL